MQSDLASPRRRDPLTHPWGCYFAPRGGDEGLWWFTRHEALVEHLAGGLWQELAGAPAPADVAGELRALLQEAPEKVDLGVLNAVLEPLGQVHWIGEWRQLCEGPEPLAADLREAWREAAGRGPQGFGPLEAEDQRAYADFLRGLFEEGS